MDADDPTVPTAAEIAARVRDGRSCAVDVARAHLARIAEREPGTGVFRAHDPTRVLAEAGGVDARADRFALPLAGVPVAVTEEVDVPGHPADGRTAAGSPDPVRRDDELVKRLRSAGAVIVGTTRVAPGGAAAVAAGLAALALDGGTAPLPAAAHGLVRLAVGPGTIPRQRPTQRCGSSSAGPVARTAGDAALMLGVLTGQPVDLDRPGPVRVALSLRAPSLTGRLHPDHRAAAVAAAVALRAGAEVVLAEPPHLRRWTSRWIHRRTDTPIPLVEWLDDAGFDLLLGAALPGQAALPGRVVRSGPAAGLPTVVAPVLVAGRPVGVQLVGRPGAEAALLAAAARLTPPVPSMRPARPGTGSGTGTGTADGTRPTVPLPRASGFRPGCATGR